MGFTAGHKRYTQPEQIYALFKMYKDARKEEAKEWPKVQYVGKNGVRVEDYPKLPLTYDGFMVWCRNNGHGDIHQYFDNPKGADGQGRYNQFVEICTHIKQEIRDNQITGGLLGAYNNSITQRLNNLAENVNQHNTGTVKVSWKQARKQARENGTGD